MGNLLQYLKNLFDNLTKVFCYLSQNNIYQHELLTSLSGQHKDEDAYRGLMI